MSMNDQSVYDVIVDIATQEACGGQIGALAMTDGDIRRRTSWQVAGRIGRHLVVPRFQAPDFKIAAAIGELFYKPPLVFSRELPSEPKKYLFFYRDRLSLNVY
jgi:hypothetical protein